MPTELHDMTPDQHRADHWQMLRFMALNASFGMLAGLGVAAALICLDINGIGTAIRHAASPALPVILIAAPLALTFGTAAAASAIILMPYKKKHSR